MMGFKGQEMVKVFGGLVFNYGEIIYQWVVDGYGIILCLIWDVVDSFKCGCLVWVLLQYFQEVDLCVVYLVQLKNLVKVWECVCFLQKYLDVMVLLVMV